MHVNVRILWNFYFWIVVGLMEDGRVGRREEVQFKWMTKSAGYKKL